MKKTDIQNPEILVKDERIERLDEIVTEVKESEEWEEVHMSIYSQAMEQGREDGLKLGLAEGREQGRKQGIQEGRQEDVLDFLRDYGFVGEDLQKKIMEEKDIEILKSWLKLASRVNSVAAF